MKLRKPINNDKGFVEFEETDVEDMIDEIIRATDPVPWFFGGKGSEIYPIIDQGGKKNSWRKNLKRLH